MLVQCMINVAQCLRKIVEKERDNPRTRTFWSTAKDLGKAGAHNFEFWGSGGSNPSERAKGHQICVGQAGAAETASCVQSSAPSSAHSVSSSARARRRPR